LADVAEMHVFVFDKQHNSPVLTWLQSSLLWQSASS